MIKPTTVMEQDLFHYSRKFFRFVIKQSGHCVYANPFFIEEIADTMSVNETYFTQFISVEQHKLFNQLLKKAIDNTEEAFSAVFEHANSREVTWELQAVSNNGRKPEYISMTGVKKCEEKEPTLSETMLEKYKAYERSAEGIWRLTLREPMSIHLSIPEQIAHCRKHGFMTECNDNMAKMYGLESGSQLVGTSMDTMMNLHEPAQIEYLAEFIRNGYKVVNGETREHDIHGNVLYILNNMTAVIEDGFLKRVWGTQQNITEKKKAEEQLLRSESFYRTLISDSLDGILLTDKNGVISYASPSVERILGFQPDDLIRTHAFDHVHPDDKALAADAFQNEVNMDPVITFIEIRLKQKYSGWVYCNVRGHNMLYNPYVDRMVIYFHDVSQKRAAEEALIESVRQHRFQSNILKSVNEFIVTSDKNLLITSWNKVAEEITGVPAEEAIGKQYRDLVEAHYGDLTRDDVLATLKEKGKWQGKVCITNKAGVKHCLLHTISEFLHDDRESAGYLGVGKLITDANDANEANERQ